MQEPAPKGIVSVDKQNGAIEANIAESVTKAGIPVTTKDISPDPLHILEGLGDMADTSAEIVGANTPDFDRIFHGEGPLTSIKTSGGKHWLQSLKERAAGRLKFLKKAA